MGNSNQKSLTIQKFNDALNLNKNLIAKLRTYENYKNSIHIFEAAMNNVVQKAFQMKYIGEDKMQECLKKIDELNSSLLTKLDTEEKLNPKKESKFLKPPSKQKHLKNRQLKSENFK